MTLIITALADDAVVQVSDRRLTLNGAIYDEHANKAVCVVGRDAIYSIAYTGSALIGGQRTDEWLVDALTDINAPSVRFPEAIEKLRGAAESALRPMRQTWRDAGVTFAFAGFGPPGPFAALLSNLEDGQGNWLTTPSTDFHSGFFLRNGKRMRKLDLMINGREDAAQGAFGAVIESVRRRFVQKTPEERANVAVQLIRMAADHPRVGQYVGKDCMSVLTTPTAGFTSEYHPLNAGAIQYMPNLITQGAAFKGAWISTDPNIRPARGRRP